MKKKEKILMVDYLNLPPEQSINIPSDELKQLETTNRLSDSYFTQSKIPYSENLENKIINTILSQPFSCSPLKSIWLKIGIAFTSILFVSFVLFQVKGIVYKKNIERQISQYISLNGPTIDFIVMNNMDVIIQQIIQNQTDATIMDDQKLQAAIKASLILYLWSHLDKNTIEKNQNIINNKINQYSNEYLDYIKDHTGEILI